MIRVAVVDDEPLARAGVIARLREQPDTEVVAEFGDGTAAAAGLAALAPDLVFLDVQMPGLGGLDVLASLPPERRPLAILLTAYDRYAVRAFELQALDYLLKPIDDDRFAEALERARQALSYRRPAATGPAQPQPQAERFVVRVGRRLVYVEAGQVEWIQADGDYAVLHVDGRSHLLRESLQRLSARLDPARFVRVHRSTIVRIDCVADLQPLANRDALLRLRDGTPVRASRTYIEPLRAALESGRSG